MQTSLNSNPWKSKKLKHIAPSFIRNSLQQKTQIPSHKGYKLERQHKVELMIISQAD